MDYALYETPPRVGVIFTKNVFPENSPRLLKPENLKIVLGSDLSENVAVPQIQLNNQIQSIDEEALDKKRKRLMPNELFDIIAVSNSDSVDSTPIGGENSDNPDAPGQDVEADSPHESESDVYS